MEDELTLDTVGLTDDVNTQTDDGGTDYQTAPEHVSTPEQETQTEAEGATPEQEATEVKRYKDLQASYTKSQQENAEVKRRLQQLEASYQQSQQRPESPLDAYKRDPIGLENAVYGEIAKKQAMLDNIDPFDPEHAHAAKQLKSEIRGIEMQLRNLKGQAYKEQQEANFKSQVSNYAATEVYKAIPDYEKVMPQMEKFATTELGISQDTIRIFGNPDVLTGLFQKMGYRNAPEAAVNAIKEVNVMIKKLYDQKTGNNLKGKEVRNPMSVEKPGSGLRDTPVSGKSKSILDKANKEGRSMSEDEAVSYLRSLKQETLNQRR